MTGEGRERLKRFFQQEDANKAAQEEQETEEEKAVQGFLEDAMARCLGTVKPAMEEAAALFAGPDRSADVDVREGEVFEHHYGGQHRRRGIDRVATGDVRCSLLIFGIHWAGVSPAMNSTSVRNVQS